MPAVNAQTQGRRGYYLYIYGTHLWFPETMGDFSQGVFRDVARTAIPQNGAYDLLDLFVDRPGVAYKRGGSTYLNPSGSTGATGTISYLNAIASVEFPHVSSQPIVAVTDRGDILSSSFASAGLLFSIGPGVTTACKPTLWTGGTANLLVITDANGLSIPTTYSGAGGSKPLGGSSMVLTVTGTPTGGSVTVSATDANFLGFYDTASIAFNSSNSSAKTALDAMPDVASTFTVTGGVLPGTPLTITPSDPKAILFLVPASYNSLTGGSSPAATVTWNTTATNCPTAELSAMHLARLVLARTPANPNRIFFSPLLDITAAWDATAYVDADEPITGIASTQAGLLVFSLNRLEKFVGDIPPGVNATTNFTHVKVGTTGCIDARSISVNENTCYFANRDGIFATDGTTITSMTDGRISSFWRALLSGWTNNWIVTTGVYARRFLYVTVLDNTRTHKGSLMCDLRTGAWVRVSSHPAPTMYATGLGSFDEIYSSSSSSDKIMQLSGSFSPSSSNKNDADGTAVAPVLETRPFGGGPGLGAFGKGHLTYDMRDAASDNPTLAVAIAPGIDAETYSAVAESPLAETTIKTRSRYSTGKRSQAVSVRFTQSNASSKTEIQMVEQDTRGFPREAGGQ